jgi:hypothetical protein
VGELGLDPETVLKFIQLVLRGAAYFFAGFALLALSSYVVFLCLEIFASQPRAKARIAKVPQPVGCAPVVEQTQEEVVQALAGLRARYGIFGCLGNHETITETEESITRLFAEQGIRMLRQERAPIQLNGEMLNLIGIADSQPDLRAVVMPDTVNILLVHYIGARPEITVLELVRGI